jgi:hypothetical protein
MPRPTTTPREATSTGGFIPLNFVVVCYAATVTNTGIVLGVCAVISRVVQNRQETGVATRSHGRGKNPML